MSNGPYFGSGRSSDCPQMSKTATQQGTAKPEPGQGARTPDSGAGGEASLAGRGTMEQK